VDVDVDVVEAGVDEPFDLGSVSVGVGAADNADLVLAR
jgi:hypothetical protein